MMGKEIEIIDIDDEIEIIDFEDDVMPFDINNDDNDLLNAPDEIEIPELSLIEDNVIKEESDPENQEKGFSHILLNAFLGGFTGGIILTALLRAFRII